MGETTQPQEPPKELSQGMHGCRIRRGRGDAPPTYILPYLNQSGQVMPTKLLLAPQRHSATSIRGGPVTGVASI